MKPYRNPSIFVKMLLASACIFACAATSSAQDAGTSGQQQHIQQQIDQLQRLLELQKQVQQLQQQTGVQSQGQLTQPQGQITQPQTAQPQSQQPQTAQPGWQQPQQPQVVQPQAAPGWQQPQSGQYTQGGYGQPQAPGRSVTLSPVDTGRNAVTFTIGGGRGGGRSSDFGIPRFAIKTNLLYAGATLTPNLAFEAGLGQRTSIELSGGYNQLSKWAKKSGLWDSAHGDGTGPDYDPVNEYKRRIDHIFGKLEFRYWFSERFKNHFVGVNAFYADYNVGELEVPLLFDGAQDYNGNAIGGGFTYGYLWRWNSHWAMEFSLGVSVAMMEYDKSDIEPVTGGYNLVGTIPYKKTYLGPTSVGIKLVFTIN